MALLIAVMFFILGFSWYHGQALLRKYLNYYAETTSLDQLPAHLGLTDGDNKLTQATKHEEIKRSGSLLIDYQSASSDEEDDNKTKSTIDPIPPTLTMIDSNEDENHLEFIDDSDDNNVFRIHSTGDVVFTVTPGLGVFLTTSSRHTPHVFERVVARIHAVC